MTPDAPRIVMDFTFDTILSSASFCVGAVFADVGRLLFVAGAGETFRELLSDSRSVGSSSNGHYFGRGNIW